ncbi:hypothetical protein C6502_21090 [Candidatus Poribacteria bacterium]|nr:MAG: hypothetical protein C6502_21090 [Candidatus Poribacteria bacterium]
MKPQCRSIQRCLSDYIDYTLSARQTIIVAQHLRFCQDCQLELKALRRTEALLRVHVPPQPPEGYYDQFGEQLQRLIEKRPRPIWWGVTAFSQAIAWRFQEFLHQSIRSFSKLISFPIGWVKQAPAYAWTLLIVLISLSAYKSFQSQEQDRSNTVNLSQVVKVQPTAPSKESGNRELVSNRERLVATTQTLPENVVQGRQNIDKEIEVIESLAELSRWEGHQPDPVSDSNFINDSDTFKAMTIDDPSPDLVAVAQLSSPEPIAAKEDFSQPLGVVAIPTSAEIGWSDNRSLNGVVEMLMNVPLPSFSITEVYDSVKL